MKRPFLLWGVLVGPQQEKIFLKNENKGRLWWKDEWGETAMSVRMVFSSDTSIFGGY